MKVVSIFEIQHSSEVVTISVGAAGQVSATSALRHAQGRVVILKGFEIDGEFKPVDLRDHWQRMAAFHNNRKKHR